jgi:hypothetical protein
MAMGSLRTTASVFLVLFGLKAGRGAKRLTAGGRGESARREGEMEELVVARWRILGRRVVDVEDDRDSEDERERLEMEDLRGRSSCIVSEGVVGSSTAGSSQSAVASSQTEERVVAHSLLSEGAEVVGLIAQGSWDRVDTTVMSELSSGFVSSCSSPCGHGDATGDGGTD